MIDVCVNGDDCTVAKHGKLKELYTDYLKGIMCIVETFAGDIGRNPEDVLTFLYNKILEIYNDNETEITKEV